MPMLMLMLKYINDWAYLFKPLSIICLQPEGHSRDDLAEGPWTAYQDACVRWH